MRRSSCRFIRRDVNSSEVEALAACNGMQEPTCVVITDRTNEHSSGTCSSGSNRLVEPLATGVFVKVSTNEGLAGQGMSWCGGDEVYICAADDNDRSVKAWHWGHERQLDCRRNSNGCDEPISGGVALIFAFSAPQAVFVIVAGKVSTNELH